VSTLIHERVELAKQGLSSQVICRLQSGWAVLGDSQFIAGYSLLLADPVVPSLNDLAPDSVRDEALRRALRRFLDIVGAAVS